MRRRAMAAYALDPQFQICPPRHGVIFTTAPHRLDEFLHRSCQISIGSPDKHRLDLAVTFRQREALDLAALQEVGNRRLRNEGHP